MHAGSLWVSPTETLSDELGKDIISGGLAATLFVFIPDSSGCYVLTSFDGNVLYVGLTKNLKRGMAQHLDNREKESSSGLCQHPDCDEGVNTPQLRP
ncbi:excinuclease ABC subunit C domain-containing protein (plasmid) [Rhizobium phaseoli]|uniref:GIY-YIG nuclease family protein n=1 Tax=Rhizobium phaseoli TaxID=396 RepID=UPI0007E9A362|nr:GIY-YIG nuclease family protein [Rhizobium phaseoli]ANL30129.1 excinuclease ABC subunit C domain-containing protein [Rhizobium phaseoli]